MRVCLVRSLTDPDPYPEKGSVQCRIALGTTESSLNRQAEKHAFPMDIVSDTAHAGTLPLEKSYKTMTGAELAVKAIRLAENVEALVVHLDTHAFSATVEGKIGHMGNADAATDMAEDRYTTVAESARYLADTGVDALAIAIGTARTRPSRAWRLTVFRKFETPSMCRWCCRAAPACPITISAMPFTAASPRSTYSPICAWPTCRAGRRALSMGWII